MRLSHHKTERCRSIEKKRNREIGGQESTIEAHGDESEQRLKKKNDESRDSVNKRDEKMNRELTTR